MAFRMALNKHIVAEWLRQERDSARLHGLDGHRYVTVTRNEDDWHVDPIAGDAFLQIETIEACRDSNPRPPA
jgi:hypothetical protein